MSIYALRGQAAYDRSREEPPDTSAADGAWEALLQAIATLDAARSAMSKGRDVDAYASIDDARDLLEGIDTAPHMKKGHTQ